MSPAGLRARAAGFFVEPREATAEPFPAPGPEASASRRTGYRAPRAAAASRTRAATRAPLRAAVLGSAGEAPPVAALLANALRSAGGAATAAVAVWAPGCRAANAPPRGAPAALGAVRLAARLTARGLPAAGRGRLAWLHLAEHPVAAAVAARRAAGALEVPLVVVLAGPRCEVVEGLLGEQDLVVVVAGEPDGPLARLAVAGCAGAALAHASCAPGPARWLALAGLAGARGLDGPLPGLVTELAEPPRLTPVEGPW